MINICDAEKTKGLYKIGYLFAFLGSATTCRCCLGARVALAFLIGLASGLVATYNGILSLAITVTFILTVILFFVTWYLAEDEEEEEELIFDTDKDYFNYIVDGIETIYGRKLSIDESVTINSKLHEFMYQGVSGFRKNAETGAPIMAQWIKILESGEAE